MKFFTPALINSAKTSRSFKAIFFGHSMATSYYQARHKKEDIYILWIEAARFGKVHCYPCVLDEAGDAMVFSTTSSPSSARANADLITRWNLFVNPATFAEEYVVDEINKKKYNIIFGDYQTLGSSASAKKLDDADTPEDENTPAEEPPQA